MQIQFVPARWFTIAHRERVDWICVHSTEGPCLDGRAMAGALAHQRGERKASAHYFVDPSNIVQCVHESDVAWHCPGANRRGIGIEHCASGLGEIVPCTDWDSPEAQSMLQLSAGLVVEVARRWAIPLVRLTPADILAHKRGIFGHEDATKAFTTVGGHRDPGKNFPWQTYLSYIATAAQELSAACK